jgi:hypothetical protein
MNAAHAHKVQRDTQIGTQFISETSREGGRLVVVAEGGCFKLPYFLFLFTFPIIALLSYIHFSLAYFEGV